MNCYKINYLENFGAKAKPKTTIPKKTKPLTTALETTTPETTVPATTVPATTVPVTTTKVAKPTTPAPPTYAIIDTISRITPLTLNVTGTSILASTTPYPIYYDVQNMKYFIISNQVTANMPTLPAGVPSLPYYRYDLMFTRDNKILILDLNGIEYVSTTDTTCINKYTNSVVNISDYDSSPARLADAAAPLVLPGIIYNTTQAQQIKLFGASTEANQFVSLITPLFGTTSPILYFFITMLVVFIFLIILLLI